MAIFSPEEQIRRLGEAIIRITQAQEAIRDGRQNEALNHCVRAEAAVSVIKDDLWGL